LTVDELRRFSARKAKADMLAAEQREKYADEYNNICARIKAGIFELFEATIAELSRASDNYNIEPFIAAKKAVEATSQPEQMGFTEIDDPECPWNKSAAER